jgi:hypothetical protein
MFPSEIWDRFKSLAGLLCVVCVCLYALRCILAWDFISVDRFGHFLRGLLRYLVS